MVMYDPRLNDYINRWYSQACHDFGVIEDIDEKMNCLLILVRKRTSSRSFGLQNIHLNSAEICQDFRQIVLESCVARVKRNVNNIDRILSAVSGKKYHSFVLDYLATNDKSVSASRSNITDKTADTWLERLFGKNTQHLKSPKIQ